MKQLAQVGFQALNRPLSQEQILEDIKLFVPFAQGRKGNLYENLAGFRLGQLVNKDQRLKGSFFSDLHPIFRLNVHASIYRFFRLWLYLPGYSKRISQ